MFITFAQVMTFNFGLRSIYLIFFLSIASYVSTPLYGVNFPTFPGYGEFVVDQAKMTNEETNAKINEISKSLLSKVKIPIYVVTINSLKDQGATSYSIESYTAALFDKWGIGFEYHNYGILFLISKDDRKARIELGKSWKNRQNREMDRIMNELIIPNFKQGKFQQGIMDGVTALKEFVDRPLSYLPKPQPELYFSQSDSQKKFNENGTTYINSLTQSLYLDKKITLYIARIDSLHEQGALTKSIDQYTKELFKHWGLNQSEDSKNILLLISTKDRNAHVELNSNWDFDSQLIKDKIMNDYILPLSKIGKDTDAVFHGINSLNAMARGQALPKVPEIPKRSNGISAEMIFRITGGGIGIIFFINLLLHASGRKPLVRWMFPIELEKRRGRRRSRRGWSSRGGGSSGSW